jgi:hypothetical protein
MIAGEQLVHHVALEGGQLDRGALVFGVHDSPSFAWKRSA